MDLLEEEKLYQNDAKYILGKPFQQIIKNVKHDNIKDLINNCSNFSNYLYNPINQGLCKVFYQKANRIFIGALFILLADVNYQYNDKDSKYYHNDKLAWNLVNSHNVLKLIIDLGSKPYKSTNEFWHLIEIVSKINTNLDKNHVSMSAKLLQLAFQSFNSANLGSKDTGSVYSTLLQRLYWYDKKVNIFHGPQSHQISPTNLLNDLEAKVD